MTQKYAIVPVRDDGGIDTAGGVFYPGKIGKVTSAQIEQMARTAYEGNEIFPFGWDAATYAYKSCCINSMVHAVRSIGLEVED